jgi:hypothetical protein
VAAGGAVAGAAAVARLAVARAGVVPAVAEGAAGATDWAAHGSARHPRSVAASVFMATILVPAPPRRGQRGRAGFPHNSPMSEKTLLLVDGSSYLYRAFHALPDLRSPTGFPTGAIHGVVAMMKKLREEYPSAHGACVFDDKGTTFRDEWYPEYKATRKAMPPDLAQQIEPIHEAVRLLGWPVLMVPGIEADDAIGTISCMAAKGGFDVVISTGDKDLAQLVNERVTLINTMSNERLDVAGVLEKFGVPPERIVDYLTLIGDSVDNIPGVERSARRPLRAGSSSTARSRA